MKYLIGKSLRLVSEVGRHRQLILLAITIAMFILAAGAPNGTIGIGK